MLPLLHPFSSRYLPYMQTELSKKYPQELYHISRPRLKGGFNGLRCFSDSQIILLQIPIALYQTRRNVVIGEEQYQINSPTKPYIISQQVLNCLKGRQWCSIYYRPSYQNNMWWLYGKIGPWLFRVIDSAISKILEYT